MKGMLGLDPGLYTQDRTCPICTHRFLLPKVRPSALRVVSRDSDFCVHYGGLNPNLYAIWACPHCGYAATETTFDELPPYQRQMVKEALGERPVPAGAVGERTPEVAIALYQQAIYLAGVRKLSPSNVAGLHLKLAWIYRELGDQAAEHEQLVAARDKYLQAFNSERLGGEGKMSEATVAYLVGELHRRTGDFREAINWLSRLVSDPRTQREPNVLNLARDGWQLARAQLKEEGDDSLAPPAAPAPAPERPAPTPAAPPSGGALSGRLAAALAAAPAAGATGAAAPIAAPAAAPAPVVPSTPAVTPAGAGRLRLPDRDQRRASRIGTNVSLYTDQVEWLRRVTVAAERRGAQLAIPEIVRAILDVVVGNVAPERLDVQDEEELRRRLIALLDRTEQG